MVPVRRAQQLGRYHLLDRIAFGGMAEIYRAKTFDSSGHAHLVAVKRVLAHLAEDDDFIQMLVDEAKIASILRHGNIARVYEFARAGGEYFIAMEHVDGKDTRTILERCRLRKKPMPPQHAAYVGAEVATALHAAHTAVDHKRRPLRIVHRDVSPSNILCAYTGEVKLCDFGIAKATLSKVNTKTGVIKGKVKYMSPEQALGRKLDHRSDVFSLGSCLYEMLTRIPPFTATNEMDLLIKVRDAKYRPIAELVQGVPPELEGIADRCLTRSRAQRYQTADEVAHDLRVFLDKYVPNYSRSHLGRYVRKLFATEIERELRMLEEFVLGDSVSDDVGENLIAPENTAGDAALPAFTPHPRDDAGAAAPPVNAAAMRAASASDFRDEGSSQTTLPRDGQEGEPAPAAASYHDDVDDDGNVPVRFPGHDQDLHGAETMILDHAPRRRAPGPPPPAAPPLPSLPRPATRPPPLPPPRPGSRTRAPTRPPVIPAAAAQPRGQDRSRPKPQPESDYDEALHNAPTLILDTHRGMRRK
jgi:serine/threonine protein kinase